jgi:hypothetical protein
MVKQAILALVAIVCALIVLYSLSRVPEHPARVLEVEVLALRDVPEQPGRRVITVKMENGSTREIETLTPFFYRPGYTASLGVFERTLFPDVFDFVADGSD